MRAAISREDAERLNEKAQALDPQLFWTCNFEPDPHDAIGADALFFANILDLYGFAIDTNCVLKPLAFNARNSIGQNLLSRGEAIMLKKSIRLVQDLRANLAHNQSRKNGTLFARGRIAYDAWVLEVLGSSCPSSLDDFSALNDALSSLGADLVRLSERIIEEIDRSEEKPSIIGSWKRAILDWYCAPSRHDHYLSQAAEHYLVRSAAGDLSTGTLRYKVGQWVGKSVTFDLERQIRKADADIRARQDRIEHPGQIPLQIKATYPDKYEVYMAQQREELERLEHEQEQRRSQLNDIIREVSEQHKGSRQAYFFSGLREQLSDTLDASPSSGPDALSLLPQGLLYADVERCLAKIPGIDGDF